MISKKLSALAILLALGGGSSWAAPHGLSRLKTVAAKAIHAVDVRVLAERSHVVMLGSEDEGFAVVSRDEVAPRVLAVCTEPLAGEPNPGVQWWLNAIDQAIAQTGAFSLAPTQFGVPDSIGPLLSTRWGQDAPYNNLCPIGADGTRCLTGCVATSTAQVMRYHRLPVRGQGERTIYYPKGDTSGTPVYAHFGATWYDWDNMRDSYKDIAYSDAEALAVAQLMMHAGVSADMMYGTDAEGGSGAVSAGACESLARYFGFTGATFLSRDDFSEENWMQQVYEQLAAYGPIVYNGSDKRGGHSFVVDGYRSDGLVHVNWGYEGAGDGYYDLATLNPSFSSGGYAESQHMMILRPDQSERITQLDLSDVQLADGLLPAKAYYGYPYLTHVVLPAGITRWGDGALGACPSLRTVVLPDAEDRQFVLVDDCLICSPDTTELIAVLSTATGRVNVPSTVTAVHAHAFDGCVGIDTLDLPAALTSIGAEALLGCGGLRQLRVRAKTPPALSGYGIFTGVWTDECHLNVPSGTATTYKRRAQWKDFAAVDEFGTTVKASNAVRRQGEPNPEFAYTVSGEPVTGVPELYTDATLDSPPGVYTIYVLPGSITSPDVEYINGRLIIEEADGIEMVSAGSGVLAPAVVTDLSGRRLPSGSRLQKGVYIVNPQKGVFIQNGKKVVVK